MRWRPGLALVQRQLAGHQAPLEQDGVRWLPPAVRCAVPGEAQLAIAEDVDQTVAVPACGGHGQQVDVGVWGEVEVGGGGQLLDG